MPKLLIVENDAFAGNFMSKSLESAGFSVISVADSAPSAMRTFRESNPDIALIDIELGAGPNGIDLARAFRKIKASIGIVFLTSIVDPRLVDLKGLELPDGSIYLSKSSVSDVSEISESLHESITLAKTRDIPCIIKFQDNSLNLTNRQFELIRLIAEGLSNKEIARTKFVTLKSTENSIARLAKKLDLKDTNTNSQRVLIAKRYFQMIGKV
ncbi:CitB Response regulator containing a CheY-like receiver domain and an HTH DNA-binding domain [Candidatus Nanopelagicaceae bacterium]